MLHYIIANTRLNIIEVANWFDTVKSYYTNFYRITGFFEEYIESQSKRNHVSAAV